MGQNHDDTTSQERWKRSSRPAYRKVYPEKCNIVAMPRRRTPSLAKEPVTLSMTGYEVVEKVAKPCATSARILVPRHWVGKRVRAVRLDP